MERSYTVLAEDKRSSTNLDADRLRVWCRTYHLFLMVIAAWVHDFYRTGVANTTLLINFFKEFTAPAVVGAFTFVSVFCVDKTTTDGRTPQKKK